MVSRKIKQRAAAVVAALGDHPAKRAAQLFLLLLLALLGMAHLKAAFLAQLAMNRGPQMAHFSGSLTQADALAVLAEKEHLADGSLDRALRLYQRGLAYFVLHVPSWLGLADLYNDLDRRDLAVSALRFVEGFAANTRESAWTKALLAHELDQEDILAANLAWLAANHPRRTAEVLSLAELRWPDPAEIMRRFGPALYGDLLRRFMQGNAPDKAGTVWREMERAGTITTDTALAYVNFLLGQDDIGAAARVWNGRFRRDDSLLYNPELRLPLAGSGFGWRISGGPGVSWQPASEKGGLRISFDGTANVSFQLRQIVPLPPGSYLFRGYMSTADLTTDQLPYWSISGYKCPAPTVTGAMPPPTAGRHEFFLPFDVPESCPAVQVTLRRNASYFFDNRIAGTFIVEELAIDPQGGSGGGPRGGTAELMPPASGQTGININRIRVK